MCFRYGDSAWVEIGTEPTDEVYQVEDVEAIFQCRGLNTVLYESCKEGSLFIAKNAIDIGVVIDWNWGLYGACQGDHKELAEWMISKGASSGVVIDWNWGLKGACEGGHKELAEFMINKGATDWNWGLKGA